MAATELDQWEVGLIEGLVQLEVAYDCVHLYPGRYLVSLAVYDGSGADDYLYHDRAYSFALEGLIASGIGVVRCPHS